MGIIRIIINNLSIIIKLYNNENIDNIVTCLIKVIPAYEKLAVAFFVKTSPFLSHEVYCNFSMKQGSKETILYKQAHPVGKQYTNGSQGLFPQANQKFYTSWSRTPFFNPLTLNLCYSFFSNFFFWEFGVTLRLHLLTDKSVHSLYQITQ